MVQDKPEESADANSDEADIIMQKENKMAQMLKEALVKKANEASIRIQEGEWLESPSKSKLSERQSNTASHESKRRATLILPKAPKVETNGSKSFLDLIKPEPENMAWKSNAFTQSRNQIYTEPSILHKSVKP